MAAGDEDKLVIIPPEDDAAQGAFRNDFTSYNKGHQKILSINASDLKLRLRDFKKTIQDSDVTNPAVGVLGVWIPFFTSDFNFKKVWGLEPNTVKSIYLVVALILSFVLARNVFNVGKSFVGRRFNNKPEESFKYENDPDKFVGLLCENDEQIKQGD